MFNDVTGTQLVDLISSELSKIEIRGVTFESRSYKTEYARIYFSYSDIVIPSPSIEIIDDGLVSLDMGSMTDDYYEDDNLDIFIALKAVAIKAQDFICENPKVLHKFLNHYDVFNECSKYGYWIKKNENKRAYDKWHLYVCEELISKHNSLAALVTTVTDELLENRVEGCSFIKTC